MVAEGVGRNLYPEANMWQLARPLIEDWIIANAGPDARMRAAAEQTVGVLRRLPRIAEQAETALERVAQWQPPDARGNRGLRFGLLWAAFATGVAVAALIALVLSA